MIAKAPGVVGCAHCKQAGADEACPGCHLLICPTCRRDLTTCDVPCARELRLGATSRLRRVSENGRYGVVSGWRRAPRLVDLDRANYLRSLPAVEHGTAIGAVTREGRYLWADKPPSAGDEFAPTVVLSIGIDEEVPRTESRAALSRYTQFEMCRGERLLYSAELESAPVRLADLEAGSLHELRPLPRQELMQACCVAADEGLLITGAYGRIYIHRRIGKELKRIGTLDLPDAEISWLGFARGRLAVVSSVGEQTSNVALFQLGDRWAGWQKLRELRRLDPQPHPLEQPTTKIVAALSDDGRFLALALADHSVLVHDFDSDTRATYKGHTDRLCLIAFSEAATTLITADCDNRVHLRPRSGRHFIDQFRPAEPL